MATHTIDFVRDMVDESNVGGDDVLNAAERIDQRAHILGAILIATTQGARDGVDDDQYDLLTGNFLQLSNGPNDGVGVFRIAKIMHSAGNCKWQSVNIVFDLERTRAPLNQCHSLKGDIEHGALLHGPAKPDHASGDVEPEILDGHGFAVAWVPIPATCLTRAKEVRCEPLFGHKLDLIEQDEWQRHAVTRPIALGLKLARLVVALAGRVLAFIAMKVVDVGGFFHA
jgi:hypothetical protein